MCRLNEFGPGEGKLWVVVDKIKWVSWFNKMWVICWLAEEEEHKLQEFENKVLNYFLWH